MNSPLVVSSSPHLRAPEDIKKIMWKVVVALLPAVVMSVYFFGLPAVRVYLTSIIAAELTEMVCLYARGEPLRCAVDGSAMVTGLLLAMVLPAGVAWYVPLVGAVFAVAVVKHAFGGLGNNIWNPALSARVFLQFAYASQISLPEWPAPRALWGPAVDAVTKATPLATETVSSGYTYLNLAFGNGIPGCIGETCKVALLLGALLLIVLRIVDWRIPVSYMGTVFVLAWLLPAGQDAPTWASDPIYHMLSGGLVIGAFFMATDMVTTPMTRTGRVVFGVGCGILVAVIRLYGGYPEGVAYSIVLMNTCTPLIDRWVRPRVYGSRSPKPAPR